MQDPPITFAKLRLLNLKWLWQHFRCIIPPPSTLYPLVEEVFWTYGPLKDATTHQPFFNCQAWDKSKQILDLICQGFVSDPPGISLYTPIGMNKAAGNLKIYFCSCGTNFTEGGVHTHLRSHLPSSGAGIRHINACLPDFMLHHNLQVCVYKFHTSLSFCILKSTFRLALSIAPPRSTEVIILFGSPINFKSVCCFSMTY